MRRTLLPILFALLFACGNLWAGGLFPGTGGGGGAADEITYDNSTSGLSATNLKDAIDEVAVMAGTGGLASVDDLPGDTTNDSKIDIGLLPTGTSSSTVALGNHTHSGLYAALTHYHTGSDITSGTVGPSYLPLNSYNSAGIVTASGGYANMVWKTDASGNPGWRTDATGGTPTFDTIGTGANTSATMTVGTGASLSYSGSGVVNASQYQGVTSVSGTEFGYLDGVTSSIQTQLNAKASSSHTHAASDVSSGVLDNGRINWAEPSAIGGTTPAAGTFTTLSAGASGFAVDADGNVTAKSLTISKTSGTAGTLRAYEANSTDTSTVGWMGPASISSSWDYQFSSTQPVANSIMLFGAPASNVSAQTWITLDDTGTNGDTAKIWSADKCYDQLALKANASHSHSGSDITSGTVSASYLPSVSGTTAGIVPTTSGVTDGYVLTKQSNGSAAWAAQTGGSGMTWPSSAGIAVYSGSSSWGTSLTAPSGAIVGTTDTQTLTNKTIDANATGNTIKGYGYITLRRPNNRGSATGATTTTDTDINYGMPSFANGVETNNYIDYYLEVPRDIDTSVDLVAWFKFRLGGADTGDHDYIISMANIGNSSAQAASPSNAVNLSYTADASGASGDIETAGGDTLTNWKSNLTAGNLWLIRITRDGDDGTNDSSSVDSYPVELTIRYGFTQ